MNTWESYLPFMGNIIIFSVPLPCLVSDWSAWSNMDATGMSYRTRMVTRPPINIDGECPPLIQSRKGMQLYSGCLLFVGNLEMHGLCFCRVTQVLYLNGFCWHVSSLDGLISAFIKLPN